MNRKLAEIFSEIADTYERVDHLLTFGMDILWRRKAAGIASGQGGLRWLDVCAGTGEMAANLVRMAPEGTFVFAADYSGQMLGGALSKPERSHIQFVRCDAMALPFASRNLHTTRDALINAYREFGSILNDSGLFVHLETSQARNPFLRKILHLYMRYFVRYVGGAVSGSTAGYAYLSNTIPRFYNADRLTELLIEGGFKCVRYERLLGGIAAIHRAQK